MVLLSHNMIFGQNSNSIKRVCPRKDHLDNPPDSIDIAQVE